MRSIYRPGFGFLAMAVAISVAPPAQAAPAGRSAPIASEASENLDHKKLHREYNDGNFEVVLGALEGYQRQHKTYAKEDSIFIAKHLAVIYSANPATREKGKYYMNVLLELMPSAKLVDMYVSDEIDHIFEKVKEEFVERQKAFGVDSSMISMPERAPRNATAPPGPRARPEEPKTATVSGEKGGHAGLWIATGAGIVAVGALTYFLLEMPGKDPDQTYVVK
jgi:hypothetical protein